MQDKGHGQRDLVPSVRAGESVVEGGPYDAIVVSDVFDEVHSFSFLSTSNLSKSDQLLTTHRSPSIDNRDSLQTSCDRPRVHCEDRVLDGPASGIKGSMGRN